MKELIDAPESPLWQLSPFIYEKSPKHYISHDALFKKLLKDYLKQFIQVFYPETYEALDFKLIDFLSEERIIDPFEDDVQFLDIVAKVPLKHSQDPIILHIEPQSYKQRDFSERMFRYANTLYNQLRKPMMNIAVFSFPEPWQEDQFTLSAPTYETYTFNYESIHLKTLDWKDFKDKPNPVSATLMCLMKHHEADRINLKVAFYRMLIKAGIGLEKGRFLLRFFDQYLPYTKEENKKVKERLKQEPEIFDIDRLPIQIEEIAKEEEKERIAISMLKDNLPIETITKHVQLSKEKIEQLKNKL